MIFFGPMDSGVAVAVETSTVSSPDATQAAAIPANYAAPSVVPVAGVPASSGRVVSLPPSDDAAGRGLAINGYTRSAAPAPVAAAPADVMEPVVPPAADTQTQMLSAPEFPAPVGAPQGQGVLGLEKLGEPSRPASSVAENELVQNMMKKMALLEREKEKLRTQVSSQGTLAELGQCAAEQNKITMLEAQIAYLQDENDNLKRANESRAAMDAASADLTDILDTPPSTPEGTQNDVPATPADAAPAAQGL